LTVELDVASTMIWLSLPAFPDEQVLRCRQRHDDDVVLVLDSIRALWREQALDLERRTAQLDRLTDRIGAAEEIRRDGGADDGDARMLRLIR